MGKSKHIEVPFLAVLMNTVAAGFQTTACVEVGQHDFGVEIMEVGENGRPVKKYLAENGSYLHFDSNNTVQTFGILEGLVEVEEGQEMDHRVAVHVGVGQADDDLKMCPRFPHQFLL